MTLSRQAKIILQTIMHNLNQPITLGYILVTSELVRGILTLIYRFLYYNLRIRTLDGPRLFLSVIKILLTAPSFKHETIHRNKKLLKTERGDEKRTNI